MACDHRAMAARRQLSVTPRAKKYIWVRQPAREMERLWASRLANILGTVTEVSRVSQGQVGQQEVHGSHEGLDWLRWQPR